ncbi:UNVERIFIED_CONTAM: hypothetical protein K2H54_024408 [Gekko kuhli]
MKTKADKFIVLGFSFLLCLPLGGTIVRMQRGCTFTCHTKEDKPKFTRVEVLCCKKKLCNTHDIWISD